MFQYAVAYALSHDFNESIVMQSYFLESRYRGASWTFREYELNVFLIERCYMKMPNWIICHLNPVFIDIWNRLRFQKRYITEKNGEFLNEFPKNAYLNGWFQSYKYFEKYDTDIKKIFQVKTPISKLNQEMLDIISDSKNPTVSIHVRRGDYVTLSEANKWHGVCSIGYYESAIAKMIERL